MVVEPLEQPMANNINVAKRFIYAFPDSFGVSPKTRRSAIARPIGAVVVSGYDAAPKSERALKGHTKRFRYVAIVEGLSYLTLLFIAMPLKYGLDMPLAVRIVGSAHGALFIAYLLFGHLAAQEQRWTIHYRVWVIVASIIPFATFVLERQLKSDADRSAEETGTGSTD